MNRMPLSVLSFAVATSVVTPSSTTAQAPPPVAQRAAIGSGTQLILLGTAGGPVIRTNRSQPATLIMVDGRPYLIDCGSGTVEQLGKVGLQASDVHNVFLTHLHFDHVAGLPALIGFNWSTGGRHRADIFGPPGTRALVAGALNFLAVPEHLYDVILPPHPSIAQIITGHDIDANGRTLVFQDDKVRILAMENAHYGPSNNVKRPYGRDRSYALRFETRDRVIVFTGDTGPSTALTAFARGADILVSEVISLDEVITFMKRDNAVSDEALAPLVKHQAEEHMPPAEIGKLARDASVGMVVLNHVIMGNDAEIRTDQYTSGVRALFKGPVLVGKDLMSL